MAIKKTTTDHAADLYAGVPAELVEVLRLNAPAVPEHWARDFWVLPILERVHQIDALNERAAALPGEADTVTELHELAEAAYLRLVEQYDDMGGDVTGVELVAAKDRAERIRARLDRLVDERRDVGPRIDAERESLRHSIHSDVRRQMVEQSYRDHEANQKERARAIERAEVKAKEAAAREAEGARRGAAYEAARGASSPYLPA